MAYKANAVRTSHSGCLHRRLKTTTFPKKLIVENLKQSVRTVETMHTCHGEEDRVDLTIAHLSPTSKTTLNQYQTLQNYSLNNPTTLRNPYQYKARPSNNFGGRKSNMKFST